MWNDRRVNQVSSWTVVNLLRKSVSNISVTEATELETINEIGRFYLETQPVVVSQLYPKQTSTENKNKLDIRVPWHGAKSQWKPNFKNGNKNCKSLVTSDHDFAHINDIHSLISGIILATLLAWHTLESFQDLPVSRAHCRETHPIWEPVGLTNTASPGFVGVWPAKWL